MSTRGHSRGPAIPGSARAPPFPVGDSLLQEKPTPSLDGLPSTGNPWAVTDPFSSLRGAARKEMTERRPVAAECPPLAAPCSSLSSPSLSVCLAPLTSPLPDFGLGAPPWLGYPQIWDFIPALRSCSHVEAALGSPHGHSPRQTWSRPGYQSGRMGRLQGPVLSEGLRSRCVLLLPTSTPSTCASKSTRQPQEPRTCSQGRAAGKGAQGPEDQVPTQRLLD